MVLSAGCRFYRRICDLFPIYLTLSCVALSGGWMIADSLGGDAQDAACAVADQGTAGPIRGRARTKAHGGVLVMLTELRRFVCLWYDACAQQS